MWSIFGCVSTGLDAVYDDDLTVVGAGWSVISLKTKCSMQWSNPCTHELILWVVGHQATSQWSPATTSPVTLINGSHIISQLPGEWGSKVYQGSTMCVALTISSQNLVSSLSSCNIVLAYTLLDSLHRRNMTTCISMTLFWGSCWLANVYKFELQGLTSCSFWCMYLPLWFILVVIGDLHFVW